jgi:hypothetical protein
MNSIEEKVQAFQDGYVSGLEECDNPYTCQKGMNALYYCWLEGWKMSQGHNKEVEHFIETIKLRG